MPVAPQEITVVTPSTADTPRCIALSSRPLVAATSGMTPHRMNVAELAAPWRSSDRVAPVSPSSRTGQDRLLHRASPVIIVVMPAILNAAGRHEGRANPRNSEPRATVLPRGQRNP